MTFSNSKIVISLLPNELTIGFIVNGNKQFINTVPLVYTFNANAKEQLIFGLIDTLLLETNGNNYETYQILNNKFDVIVEDTIFEQFIDYLYKDVLKIDNWKGTDIVSSQPVLVFQHNVKEGNMFSFANKFRKLIFESGSKIPVYQIDTDMITSMYYSNNASLEKTNMVINLQESFSKINVYNSGVEIYKLQSAISGSYLNYQLIEKGVVSTLKDADSSTKQWQDNYSWLTRCRGFMLNFVPLEDGANDLDTLKQYYNSKGEPFLFYKDQNNSLKIDLVDLEKIKKEYLYEGFNTAISVKNLIDEAIDHSLPLRIQLFNKQETSNKKENEEGEQQKQQEEEERGKMEIEKGNEQSTFVTDNNKANFVNHLKQEYPKKEKSYSYKIVNNTDPQSKASINKIIVRVGANLTIIPFFFQVIRQLLKEKLFQHGYNASDYEVVIDEDFNSWEVVTKFSINCNDKEVLLVLNKN